MIKKVERIAKVKVNQESMDRYQLVYYITMHGSDDTDMDDINFYGIRIEKYGPHGNKF